MLASSEFRREGPFLRQCDVDARWSYPQQENARLLHPLGTIKPFHMSLVPIKTCFSDSKCTVHVYGTFCKAHSVLHSAVETYHVFSSSIII